MNIRFVSSLTAEDEDRLAPALLTAVAALLDPLEFAYSLRIETTGTRVLQHIYPPAVVGRKSREDIPASREMSQS